MKKNETGHLSYIIYKKFSKWIKGLNVRPKTITLLEENIREKLHNNEFGNNFLDIPKAQGTKAKISKWDFKSMY